MQHLTNAGQPLFDLVVSCFLPSHEHAVCEGPLPFLDISGGNRTMCQQTMEAQNRNLRVLDMTSKHISNLMKKTDTSSIWNYLKKKQLCIFASGLILRQCLPLPLSCRSSLLVNSSSGGHSTAESGLWQLLVVLQQTAEYATGQAICGKNNLFWSLAILGCLFLELPTRSVPSVAKLP